MTRRKILAIIIALTMCISICGCDVGANTVQDTKSYSEKKEEIEEKVKEIEKEREDRKPFIKRYSEYLTISSDETYFLFETKDKQVYLDFLEDLDEEIYEIVFMNIENPRGIPTQYRITFTKK